MKSLNEILEEMVTSGEVKQIAYRWLPKWTGEGAEYFVKEVVDVLSKKIVGEYLKEESKK